MTYEKAKVPISSDKPLKSHETAKEKAWNFLGNVWNFL